jgi:hypothetical protein
MVLSGLSPGCRSNGVERLLGGGASPLQITMPRAREGTTSLELRILIRIIRLAHMGAWLTAAARRFHTCVARCVVRRGERDETDVLFAVID